MLEASKRKGSKSKGDYVVFTSLIRLMMNSRRTQNVGISDASCEKCRRSVALKRSARQNTLALSKPTSLRESAWKDFFMKIMKIILLEKE